MIVDLPGQPSARHTRSTPDRLRLVRLRHWRALTHRARHAITFGALGALIAVNLAHNSGHFGPELSAFLLVIAMGGMLLSRASLFALIASSELALAVIYVLRDGWHAAQGDGVHLLGETCVYASLFAGTGLFVYLSRRSVELAIAEKRAHQTALAEHSRWLNFEISERQRAEVSSYERSTELNTLVQTASDFNASLEIAPLLDSAAQHIAQVLPYRAIEISEILESGDIETLYACGPDGFTRQALSKQRPLAPAADLHLTTLQTLREPVVIEALHGTAPLAWALQQRLAQSFAVLPELGESAILAPLIMREQVRGYLLLTVANAQAFTPIKTTVVSAFAHLVGDAIEKSRLHHQAMQSVALGERHRLARELHDLISQSLFGIVLGVRTIQHSVENNLPAPHEAVRYVHDLAEAALDDTRALVFELRPDYLSNEGLLAALKKQATTLCERSQIKLRGELTPDEPDLPLMTKEAIYGIVIEAIKNVIQHAGAKHIDLTIRRADDALHVLLRDDGIGADLNARDNSHRGLRSMRDRAKACGAILAFAFTPNAGTQISLTIPTRGYSAALR